MVIIEVPKPCRDCVIVWIDYTMSKISQCLVTANDFCTCTQRLGIYQ